GSGRLRPGTGRLAEGSEPARPRSCRLAAGSQRTRPNRASWDPDLHGPALDADCPDRERNRRVLLRNHPGSCLSRAPTVTLLPAPSLRRTDPMRPCIYEGRRLALEKQYQEDLELIRAA